MRWPLRMYNYYARHIFVALCLVVLAVESHAQRLADSLSFECRSCKAEQLIKTFSQQHSTTFSYNPEIFDKDSLYSIQQKHLTLQQWLDMLSDALGVSYDVLHEQVVLYLPATSYKPIYEQPADSIIQISANIRDKHSGKILPYATVGVMNSIYGTTSNAEGLFTLRLPDSLTADTLHISYVGYIPDYVAVSHLIDSQYTIALQPDFIPIQEVVIRHAQGPELVAKAIAQIPNNYYKEAINLTAFYRESIYKNNELAAITEAVLELYKSKQINNFDQLKLVKGRNLVDNQRHDTLAVKIKAGIDLAMLLDVVREKPDFLQDDGHQFYQYKMADIMKINEKDHFVISFEQHAHINMPLYKGYLYINAEDLAISRLEFEVNPAHVHKMYGMVSKKPRNYKVKPHRMDYTIVYTNSDNGYALNFFQCSLEFRIRKKKQWFYRHYNTRIEMAVTETITRDVHRFKLNELANSQKILSEETGAYDPAFWALYNFIAPDMPLQEALGRLFDVNY